MTDDGKPEIVHDVGACVRAGSIATGCTKVAQVATDFEDGSIGVTGIHTNAKKRELARNHSVGVVRNCTAIDKLFKPLLTDRRRIREERDKGRLREAVNLCDSSDEDQPACKRTKLKRERAGWERAFGQALVNM